MEAEITLVIVFFISLAILKTLRGRFEFARAGRIAMAAMLVVTASGHFLFTKGMAMMLPGFIPFKVELIYLTGVMEIIAAIGLCLPKISVVTGWLLIAFFIALLPANIYEAIKHVDIQTGTFDGKGPNYLWYRIPLQIFFIFWVYLSAIKIWADEREMQAVDKMHKG